MAELSPTLMQSIREHAEHDFPRESCGLIMIVKGRRRYFPCRNIAEKNEHFVIHPDDLIAAEDAGTLAMVVHSHPNVAAVPSQADLVGIERSGVPWLIINIPTGEHTVTAPTGYQPPLIGREFLHGVLDCYELIKDYYRIELGIGLPAPQRDDEWWLKGQNLYLDNFESADFERVAIPRQHDVLLMQVASSVPNHGAIFLGDGCILHHQMCRLSSKDVYGGWYRKITTHILRHRSQF